VDTIQAPPHRVPTDRGRAPTFDGDNAAPAVPRVSTVDTVEPPARTNGPVGTALESARYLVVIGSATSLALAAITFTWAVVKAGAFTVGLITGSTSEDDALVKLFESIDTLLLGTVLLVIGLGLWELFVGDLKLPPALTMSSFDDLKAKVATTLLMVLVVRFLEALVSRPASDQLLELGVAVTLVGGLLLLFANWRHGPPVNPRNQP
jgi:uncharacterized membrane protein YqhA